MSQWLARYLSKSSGPQVYFGVSPIGVDNDDRFVRNVEQALRQWASVTQERV